MPDNLDNPTDHVSDGAQRELEKFQAQLRAHALKAVCIMCGNPATVIGLWMPDAGTRKMLNEPAGKTRVVAYGLCLGCMAANTQDEIMKTAEARAFELAHRNDKTQS